MISLEHAGLGHKTLAVLLELRPDYLKLDRDAIAGLAEDGARQVQLANLVKVANDCGCSVVVAGVETEEQRRLLCKLGASLGQGYLFGRPVQLSPAVADSAAVAAERAVDLTGASLPPVLRLDGARR